MRKTKDLLQITAALILPFLAMVLLFVLLSSRIETFFIGKIPENQLRSYHSVVYAGNEALSSRDYAMSTADDMVDTIAWGQPTEPPHDQDCVCCC